MAGQTCRWAIRIGRVGMTAGGLIFLIIGFLLVQAAWKHDSGQAGGLGKALQKLSQQSYGTWLLAARFLGLIAYALHCPAQARSRQISPP